MESPDPKTFSSPDPKTAQSTAGLWSFIVAIVAFLGTVVVMVVAGYLEMNVEGGVGADPAVAAMVGFAALACVALYLLGFVLGLVGVMQRDKRRTLAGIGLGLNAVFVAVLCGLIWIGMQV